MVNVGFRAFFEVFQRGNNQIGVFSVCVSWKKKGELMGLLFCFYECFYENEYSDHYKNHTYYAFDIIGRQYLVSGGVCCQYGIGKQECSEAYDDYSHYEIFDFHG